MKRKNILLVVKDIETSKRFYRRILGLKVLLDFNGHVTLSSGIVLQSYEIWKDLIRKEDQDIHLQNHACELYFEVEDIDIFMYKLNDYNVPLVHPLKEQAWGQRVVRFYDPDGHMIEVAECLKKVAKRFFAQGLSYEEIAKRMNVPVDYIRRILKR